MEDWLKCQISPLVKYRQYQTKLFVSCFFRKQQELWLILVWVIQIRIYRREVCAIYNILYISKTWSCNNNTKSPQSKKCKSAEYISMAIIADKS